MKLDFTLPELQTIVNALVRCPYGEVAELIANIKTQHDAATQQQTQASQTLPTAVEIARD